MTSSKPYLIRALHEWIIDNGFTPYLAVNANFPGVQVPEDYVDNGRIILNIAPQACRGLHLKNDRIVFSARFSGVAYQIHVPPEAVQAIYAKENGRGMIFGEEGHIEIGGESGNAGTGEPPSTKSGTPEKPKSQKPTLKIIK